MKLGQDKKLFSLIKAIYQKHKAHAYIIENDYTNNLFKT